MGGVVTSEVIRTFEGTKGWVRFLAIVGFIFTVLMLIGSLGIMTTAGRVSFGGLGIVMGLIYLLLGVLNFLAAYKLNRYATRISELLLMPNELKLVAALDAQRGFWKYTGIMAICVVAFYLLVVVAGIVNVFMN